MSFDLPERDDTLSTFNLAGRTALVTGGGSGLGRAICWGFACFGARVAVVDVDRTKAEDTANSITQRIGVGTVALPADVALPEAAERVASRTIAEWGAIDILVNAAGGNCRKPFTEMSPDEFDGVLGAHVRGTFHFCKAVAPGMIARRSGTIINIASIIGLVALPNVSAYAAAKGAIIQFTKAAALELAPFQIRVNALAPGFHDTPLTRQHTKEARERFIESTPMRRFAASEEIIGPAVFLASRASSFVTGAVLLSDGGWTAA